MRIRESCASLFKKALPWIVAAAVPVACASPDPAEDIGRVEQGLTTTVTASADSYVRSTAGSTNYGSSTTLLADGNDGGAALHAYLRFVVPSVSGLSNAKLRLRITNSTSGSSSKYYEVRSVSSNSWSETGLTWNNKPATGSVITTFSSASSGTWLELDVTGAVTAGTTVSLAIVPHGITDGVDFSSRETSNDPQLVLTYSDGSGGSGSGGSGGSSGSSGSGGAQLPTDANLKIAFVGDTSDGNNWGSVLSLVQQEGAHAVVVQGDMTYDSDPPGWWSRTESVVGSSYPVFLARGNHDDASWSGFQAKANNHLGGASRSNAQSDSAYLTVFRGLAIGTIKKGDTSSTLDAVFNGDNHLWKICSWHQNQQKMQIGGKGDEMGWAVYNRCRDMGAIIMTAHEHSYERTKTMTDPQTQSIDSSCPSGSNLCVGPGRTFVTVSGLGGNSVRSQSRCTPSSTTAPFPSLNTSDASCPIWAAIYTSNQGATYGAQFITFNVGGDPKKATGYFKTVAGNTVDTFSITHD